MPGEDVTFTRAAEEGIASTSTARRRNSRRSRFRIWPSTLFAAALLAAPAAEPEFANSLGMKMVRIEPGEFRMGQDGAPLDFWLNRFPERVDAPDYDEKPVHTVRISRPFWIGATEVTNRQYEQFDPSHKAMRGRLGVSTGDGDAVVFVNWNDAVAFCRWLSKKEGRSYRLPTEAEWEYASRAGSTRIYAFGDRLPAGHQKWILNGVPGDTRIRSKDFVLQKYKDGKLPPEYGDLRTLTAGQTKPNAWGLFDMHGNVEEWVRDWYGAYEPGLQIDPVGRRDGDFRVTRGGSYSQHASLLRSANRAGYLPHTRTPDVGFRVVLGDTPRTQPLPVPPLPLNARNVSQRVPRIVPRPPDQPYFKGPRPYVKVPAGSVGPAYSMHNHSPGLTECPNGDLLAVWYSCLNEAEPALSNLASRLIYGSEEWQEASIFWDQPDANDHAPKLWWAGKKTLYHAANGIGHNILRTSTDNGATWSKARDFDPQGELSTQPAVTREGWFVFTLDSGRYGIVLSKDGGQTWSHTEIGAEREPLTFAERMNHKPGWTPGSGLPRFPGLHNTIVQLKDESLLAFARLDDVESQARFDFKTPMSLSRDMGKTWDVTASEFPVVSSTQRPVMIRLKEGPLLWCSFTDQARNRNNRKGMRFRHAGGGEYTGYGLYAALSFDEGTSWPVRKLVTPGGPPRKRNSTDNSYFVLSDTEAEVLGYLAAIQARDGTIHLISSKNHYEFNLAWLKQLPAAPR
jgi:formylglycine-generating enzyme required for sulfatase activity